MGQQLLCTELIGRRTELEHLEELVRSFGTAVVIGDPGIGKSRLVREAVRRLGGEGAVVFVGRAVQTGPPTPYRPIAEALVAGCRLKGLPESVDLIPYRPALGRLIPEWRQPDLAASAESSVVLGEGVLRLLRTLAGEAGVLLVLEDLHWADPESLTVLEYLTDHAHEARIACIVTARPETSPATAALESLVARRSAFRIELAPLSPQESAALAEACLQAPRLANGLSDLIARADGVPFLIEELLAAAEEAGALVHQGGTWVFDPRGSAIVPRTFAETVARRMESLPTRDRAVPKLAALFGRYFDVSLVAAAMRTTTVEETGLVLEQCEGLNLISATATGYQFRHALTHEAVLAALTPTDRAVLAERALDALHQAYPGLPGQWCQTAANISLLGGDADRAAGLLLRAGRRALADGALETAADILAQAREHAHHPPLLQDIDEVRTEVAAAMGDLDTALTLSARLQGAGLDPGRHARVRLAVTQAACAAGRWELAQEQVRLAETTDEVTLTMRDALAAQVWLGAGQPDKATNYARRALDAAERLSLGEAACQALAVLGQAARVDDLQAAEAVFRRQLEIATRYHLTLWVVQATHELGTIDMIVTNGVTRLIQARDMAARAGALGTVATLDLQLAASHLMAVDAEAALEAAARCQTAARDRNLTLPLAMALVYEAKAHALRGDRSAMERALTEVDALDRPEAEVRSGKWACRAAYSWLADDLEAALAACEAAVSLERDAPTAVHGPHWGLWVLLRTALDRNGEAARADLEIRIPRDMHLNRSFLTYAEAVALGRSGDRKEAERLFGMAGAMIRVGRGWETRRHLAERLVAQCALEDAWGDPVGWLTEAAAFFSRLGYRSVERGCRSLLRQAGAALPRTGRTRVPRDLVKLGITDREADVLALITEGLTSREIAVRLYISARTVDKHVERILAKTGLLRRSDLRGLST